jgi:hypothetical protein
MRVWAACTEGRVRGVEEDAMVGMEKYEGEEETFYASYLAVLSTFTASIPYLIEMDIEQHVDD